MFELDSGMRTHTVSVGGSGQQRCEAQVTEFVQSEKRLPGHGVGFVSEKRGLRPQSTLTFDTVLSPGSMTL